MSNLPTGAVTFLFTDIENSAPLYQNFPDAMPRALAQHHQILQDAIIRHNGHVFQIIGDAFCAAFESAGTALHAALDAQRALYHASWGEIGALRVRIGLHTGEAATRGDDYVSSLTLVRAQRFMHAGHGGQILLSGATAERVRGVLPEATTLRDLGVQKLRGLAQPEMIYQLIASDLPSEFPPLRVAEAGGAQDSAALLDQLVRGKLVGRETEVELLQHHWNTAQQARAHLVTISGEPGVGKTRLANELIVHAQREGAMLLRGGCYEYEATTPYLPFVEALRDWVHWQSAESLRAYMDATAPEIGKFVPELTAKLGEISPNPPLPPNEERLRLFDNIARFLQKLAPARGLLFFIDDLHWADQGTINLLHYLLRHLRSDRVLLLGAYREVELDRKHPLAAALVEWNREHLVTRLSIGRLARFETGILLASLFGMATISDEFIEVMYRETEGNPFFIEEVVKALIEQGQIYRENHAWQRKQIADLAIPQSVKEAIGRRLNRLTEICVETLRIAAALGKVFSFAELAAVSNVPENELLDALDEASAGQLLRANDDDTFAFTHDKIREVLYEELNPIRRRRLHQRIGEGLEKLYPPPNGHTSDLAYHFTQSGDAEKSLTYSMRAAENAERVFAHDDALKFYQQARDAAETLQRVDALAQVDERIGDIYRLRGDITPAVESYERARAFAADAPQRAALNVKIGLAYSPIGDTRGMDALVAALKELNPQTQPAQYAFALGIIGRHHHYHTQHKKAVEFFEKALALAEPLDNTETLANLYSFLSGSYQHILEFEESNRWAQRNIELGTRKNFPEAVALGYEFLSENAFICGHWDDAIRYAKEDRDIGKKIGSLARVSWADFALAAALLGKGELREAEHVSMEGLDIAEQLGENRVAIWLESQLARVLVEMGEDERAIKYAEQGLAASQALGQIVLRAWALQAMGFFHWRRREFVQAAEVYQQGLDVLQGSENRVALNSIASYAAQAFLNAGRIEQAAALAQQALALAESADAPQPAARSRDVLGQIWSRQEKWDDAQRAYDQAIATFEQLGSRLELARVLEHRAALFHARNEIERAAQDDARARELFIETGAKR